MTFELTCKLTEKFDVVNVSDKFRKREFVVETSENNYTETIKFQCTQDRVGLLDNLNVNDEIKISFNLKGRKWQKEDKVYFFNTLDAWRIDVVNASKEYVQESPPDDIVNDDDDLPF